MHIRKLLAITFLVFVYHQQLAQPIATGYRNSVNTKVFASKVDSLSIDHIIRNHQSLFNPTDSVKLKRNVFYWFKLDFSNEKDLLINSDTIYIVTGTLDKAVVFYGDSILQQIDIDYSITSKSYHVTGPTTLTIPIPAKSLIDQRYVFMRVKFFRGIPSGPVLFRYNTEAGEWVNQNFVSLPALGVQVPIFILIGIAGLFAIFNLILYFFTRERLYLFYLSFLVFQLVYYSRGSPLFSYFLFGGNQYATFVVTEIAQVAANLSYLIFVKYFLETKKLLPLLDKVIKIVALALSLFIVIDTALLLWDPFFQYQGFIMYGQRYFMGAFAIVGVVYLLLSPGDKLRYFIIAGTIAYAGGALATLFLGRLSYMIYGSSIETIIFGIGLAYKIRFITLSKIKSEREAHQVKLSALRAQMNPHFIFNSLNSIQHLISKSDRVDALKYLTKFSTLLRQILESSINVNITIKEEIELLKIYLELESLRFDQSFHYEITVDPSLEIHHIEVPILLLQPYVENSINHGLMPKQSGEKNLFIKVMDDTDFIICTIRDTGIGRKASGERKKNLKIERPSRGLELSRQRLNMINENYAFDNLITITDSDEGTTVEIKIPKS